MVPSQLLLNISKKQKRINGGEKNKNKNKRTTTEQLQQQLFERMHKIVQAEFRIVLLLVPQFSEVVKD